MPLDSTQTFIFGAICSVIGWFANGLRVTSRDRKIRKQQFIAFLEIWESEASGEITIVNSLNVVFHPARQFPVERTRLIEKAREMELNYRGRKRASFCVVVKTITDMTTGTIDGEQSRQELVGAIRNLAAFVRKN